MAKTKEQKESIIKNIKENIEKQKSIVFVDFAEVDSKSLATLREDLKNSDCLLMIVKKTLLKKTFQFLQEKGTWKEQAAGIINTIDGIKGHLALVFGFGDEVAPAKICYGFSKENKNLEILGGILNYRLLNQEEVIELAKLPSRNDLLSRLVYTIKSPIFGFVNVLNGNIKGLIYALNAIKDIK